MKHSLYKHEGQSAAEYALIIGLAALVVIVVTLLVGLGVQRIYGLVAGALGAHYDTHGKHTIEITSAQCISVAKIGQTGLQVIGNTDEAIADLTGSTELGLSPVSADAGGFLYHPMIDADHADASKCPVSVVIQGKDGAIAVAPCLGARPPLRIIKTRLLAFMLSLLQSVWGTLNIQLGSSAVQ